MSLEALRTALAELRTDAINHCHGGSKWLPEHDQKQHRHTYEELDRLLKHLDQGNPGYAYAIILNFEPLP